MDNEKMIIVTREQIEEFKRQACDRHIERLKKMVADKDEKLNPMVELGEFVTCCLVTGDMIDLMFGKDISTEEEQY